MKILIRACLKIARGSAARDFGCWQGGEAGASPQRAVTAEPTQSTDKRSAARRVFEEKAVWLRCSSVTGRFSSKTAPLGIFRQALSLAAASLTFLACETWAAPEPGGADTSKKITGVAREPDGKPAAGLSVVITGSHRPDKVEPKTDAEGKFEVEWNPRQFGPNSFISCLLIRDPARNLAVAQELNEDLGSLDLKLSPGITIVGRAECDGKPVTNVTAALVFWTGNSGLHLQGLSRQTAVPGEFEIPALPAGRRYGLQVSAPGYGQSSINVDENREIGGRIETDVVELRLANMKIAGRVVDADVKPVSDVFVNLHGNNQPSGNARTDDEGRFEFKAVCEGAAQLYANYKEQSGSISADGGDTNVVLKLGESSSRSFNGDRERKLGGIVTDQEGKPVQGAQVAVFPTMGGGGRVKTDANGVFSLKWSIQSWQLESGGDPLLVVRDFARNLAALETLNPDATNANVQLSPGVTLRGRVEKQGNVPLANAEVGLWLQACRNHSELNERTASTDSDGNFTIKTVPAGSEYLIFASAKNFGRHQEQIEVTSETNLIYLNPFVLKPADQIVAGQVLSDNDKPVSGAHVSVSGDDQPNAVATTDKTGRFHFNVCEGEIRIFANGQNSWGNATAEAGDTNVVVQLTSNESRMNREQSKRSSLKDKPMPDLSPFGLPVDLSAGGKPLLLCLIDAEQRPSRHAARTLANQNGMLETKGVAVAALQTALVTAESWQSWTNSSPMPFAVGRLTDGSADTKWVTEVPSLPWLILRNAEGKVVAEGFPMTDLESKLGALKK